VYISRYLTHSLFRWVQTSAFATAYKIIPLFDSCQMAENHPVLSAVIGAIRKNEECVSAAIRKQKNELSCPLYQLSNDELKFIFEYIGEMQFRFVACTSYRFHQVYIDTFGGETLTSMENILASECCTAVYLDSNEPGSDIRAKKLFNIAAEEGKHDILIWGEENGYDLVDMLDVDSISNASLNGHFEVVRYLLDLGVVSDIESDIESDASMYYESDYTTN